MTKLLILAWGSALAFRDVTGRSLLADFPVKSLLLVNRGKRDEFAALEGDFTLEAVRWNAEAEVAARVAELHAAEPFIGIATFDENLMMLAATLRAKLGIPGMLPNEANFFRNKLVMKKSLSAAGLRTPWFAECTDRAAVENLLARYGAVVVKPVDGYGSRGVEFIRSPEQLAAWYARCKAPAAFEAEELIEGVLYHVNAVVRSGLPALTASAIYLPGMGNIDFSAGAPFVSAIVVEDGLRCRLEEFSDKVIATLGLRDGVTHLECFVTTEGEIVFCEIAARPGGGGIVWMIEAQYGVNYNRVVLLLEAGRSDLIAIPNESGAGVAGLIGFRSAQSAFVERAAKPDDFRDDWIRLSQIDVSEGAFKAASAHCTDFLGLLIFNSRDMDEFEQNRLHLSKRFYDALELRAI